MICRNCGAEVTRIFVDLGTSPLSNAYVTANQLDEPEPHFPLRPHICDECMLVQLPVFATPATVFEEYAFFSGQSETWVRHCARLAEYLVHKHGLTRESRVLELASNDGTLLRSLLRWTPHVTGVEPARNIARQALLDGLPTIARFWGNELAEELIGDGYQADFVIANNVLAHVPDLDDFVGGIKRVLAPGGIVVLEVPSLVNLIADNQFDTIYHEHLSYFTGQTVCDALERRGLRVFALDETSTHGGSLRLYACDDHEGSGIHVTRLSPASHYAYENRPAELKQHMLETLTALRHEGRMIAGYGAPAKATTFLTYCGIGPETIDFIVDSTPAKQGKYLPGARIPILHPAALAARQPDVILILPWNWEQECFEKIKRDCPWEPMVLCRDRVLADGKLAAAA